MLPAEYSAAILQARGKWQEIFKVMKEWMLQSRILYSTRLSVIFKRIWLEITKSQMRKLTGQGKDTVKRSQPHTYDIKTSNYDKRRVQMEERRTEFEIKRPSSVDGHLDYFQNLTIMNNAAVTISSIHFSSVTQSCLSIKIKTKRTYEKSHGYLHNPTNENRQKICLENLLPLHIFKSDPNTDTCFPHPN